MNLYCKTARAAIIIYITSIPAMHLRLKLHSKQEIAILQGSEQKSDSIWNYCLTAYNILDFHAHAMHAHWDISN